MKREAMFGKPGTYPSEIRRDTVDLIVLAALCDYFGGDALEEQEPGDPEAERALFDLEHLSTCMWPRADWRGLATAINERVRAIRDSMAERREEG